MLLAVAISAVVAVVGLAWALTLRKLLQHPRRPMNSGPVDDGPWSGRPPGHMIVRLSEFVAVDDEAVVAFVPAGARGGHLYERPPSTWGTLSVRMTDGGPTVQTLERWRDEACVLNLTSEDSHIVHLEGAGGDIHLALN
jgi:hypothetical protein